MSVCVRLRFPFRTMLRVDKDVESDCLHRFCIRETGAQSKTPLNTAWLFFGKPACVILVSKAHSDKYFCGATVATEREESLASLPCLSPHRQTQQPFPVPAMIIPKLTRTKASYRLAPWGQAGSWTGAAMQAEAEQVLRQPYNKGVRVCSWAAG